MPPRHPQPLLSLRDVEPADLPTLFAFQSEPESCDMAMVNARTEAQFQEVWAKIFQDLAAQAACHLDATAPSPPRVVAKAIIANGQLCGSIGCFFAGDRYSVGYGIGREFWGRGLASRALAQLLVEVTTRPIHATVAAGNTRSLRILKKNGFMEIGRSMSPGTERYRACEEVCMVLR